jgi:hypothetical protein
VNAQRWHRSGVGVGLAAVLILAGPPPARAQQPTPSDILSFLITNQSVATGDFQKDEAAAAATRDTITRALVVNLAAVPIPSSSSGFAYRLNSELGTMQRLSENFGTFFVERAATSGKGRFLFGSAASTAAFDQLDGLALRDGTLVTTANQFRDEAAPFDVESLTLRVRTSTLTIFGSYGLTDRLDVSTVVPFGQVHFDGQRVSIYRGQRVVQASASADASGLGDVAIRGKYVAYQGPAASLAMAAELRLPTGDKASLLGSGSAAVRVLGIASIERGAWGVHGNAGIVKGGASSEWDTAGAVSVALTSRVSASGEVLVRRLLDLERVAFVSAPHPLIAGVDTLRLAPGSSTTVLSNAVTGLKWNVRSTWVVSGQCQWRLGKGGLTAAVAPSLSVDYLF